MNGREPGARAIQSLAELESLVREPMRVELLFPGPNGQGVERRMVEVVALRPVEAARVNDILERAFPPVIPGKDGGEPQLDLANAEYRAAKDKNKRLARAVAVFLGCPLFRLSVADASALSPEDIQAHVESHGTDEMLDLIFERVIGMSQTDVEGRVSFFYPGGFPGRS